MDIMATPAIVPYWFIGYNVVLELVFAVIGFLVCYYGYKVYKLSGQKQPRLFCISFLFIAIAYSIQSVLNLGVLDYFNADIGNTHILYIIGIYLHIFFLLTGLITLTYMTFKVSNWRIYSLLFVIVMLSIFLSINQLFLFYLLSSILLLYICYHYFKNYLENRQGKTLLVLVAFIFLLFGKIHFLFALDHATYYAVGHILELVAYVLILINLIMVTRKPWKI